MQDQTRVPGLVRACATLYWCVAVSSETRRLTITLSELFKQCNTCREKDPPSSTYKELTDAYDWLVSLRLTEKTEYAPPTQTLLSILLTWTPWIYEELQDSNLV